jgi:hypothetical protein
MADGYFPTLISKDKDPNLVSNPVFVELSDGTAALGTTTGSLNVQVQNTSIAVTGTFWQATQPVSGTFWQATQPISGTVTANQGTAAALSAPWPVILSNGTVALGTATNPIAISATAAANSSGNPIYVSFVAAAITGAVCDYLDSSTVNHDYTVTTNMQLKEVSFACSGGGKVELKVGPVATLVTKWVGFIPKQGGVISQKFDPPIVVPTTSTGTVRLIRTNRESSAQDLYSTIIGIDA